MLFNSIDFLIFFTLVLIGIYLIKIKKFQHIFLLVASYFFFYYSNNYLILLLIYSTIIDFYLGKAIYNTTSIQKKKILLIASLAGNLGLLGFYKYSDFAILQFNILGNSIDLAHEIPLLNIALPVGISFYTFQTISYTVDIYRKKLEPSDSFWEFALFVSFFPQLVAGPIVRASEFLPQLREKIENIHFKNNLSQQIKFLTCAAENNIKSEAVTKDSTRPIVAFSDKCSATSKLIAKSYFLSQLIVSSKST